MDEIKLGSFVRIEAPWGDGHWCEVIDVLRPITNIEKNPERTYKVQTCDAYTHKYTLAPDTAHKNMIKEVLNLDPAVADIFRETTMKEDL